MAPHGLFPPIWRTIPRSYGSLGSRYDGIDQFPLPCANHLTLTLPGRSRLIGVNRVPLRPLGSDCQRRRISGFFRRLLLDGSHLSTVTQPQTVQTSSTTVDLDNTVLFTAPLLCRQLRNKAGRIGSIPRSTCPQRLHIITGLDRSWVSTSHLCSQAINTPSSSVWPLASLAFWLSSPAWSFSAS